MTLSSGQLHRARRLKRFGYTPRRIAAMLMVRSDDVRNGLRAPSTSAKHQNHWDRGGLVDGKDNAPCDRIVGAEVERYVAATHQADAALFDARDRLSRAAQRRSLTGSICGDPPPGYSALDRKRSEAIS